MIIGLGLDIVETERIRRLYERFGQRFPGRILAPGELALMPANAVPYIASRFAAKEAAVKALGTGFARGIVPQQIETVRDLLGKPALLLHGEARRRADTLGVSVCHVSLTHERNYAAAVVILEG